MHISCFIFLANDLQSQAIFLFKFNMGHKTVETTHNINNACGPWTANKHTVQWWFNKFCKGDKSLEDEEHNSQPSKVENDQLRDQSWFSYNYRSYCQTFYGHLHLKQIAKVKKLGKWVPPELPPKKFSVLKCLLFFYATMNHFSDCDMWRKVNSRASLVAQW